MSKFQVTLHRYLQQRVTVEIEPEAGVAPISAADQIDRSALAWEDVREIALSSDCVAVPVEAVEDEGSEA